MPTGSGLHLIHDLEKLKIQVPVIYISSMVDMIPKRENVTIIRKPLIVSHFIDEIKKSLKI
jgi:FixJ family two-component response regulator